MSQMPTHTDLHEALDRLLNKYAVVPPVPWQLALGEKAMADVEDRLTLAPGSSLRTQELPDRVVPLFPWRYQRRFVELKRLLVEKTVTPLLMCRFACLTDGRQMPLEAILYREFDLVEWLSGSRIISLCASLGANKTANVILHLADGVIASVEAGITLPAGAVVQDRHELIARRGVACDRVVDTQVGQSSIYVWQSTGHQQYTDVDAELFGLDIEQVAWVRAAYDLLRHPESIPLHRQEHERLRQLVELAYTSDIQQQPLVVEKGGGANEKKEGTRLSASLGHEPGSGADRSGTWDMPAFVPAETFRRMPPLKVAMLSLTHGHTRKYFQTLQDSPKLDWVAACAADENARQRFQRAVSGVPCYDNEEEMFDRHPEIEAVILASPNSEHLRQVEACAQRGLHILSMKIPSFDLVEYDRMIELVDQAGIVCQIELELHYNPVVQRIKKLMADDTVGRILSIQATNITLSPVWAFPWQGSPEQSYGRRLPLSEKDARFRGGALCDHPHVFDLIRWLTRSDIELVYAEVAPNMRTDLEVEDLLLVNGKMTDGSSFLLDPSWSRLEERLPEPGPGWEVFPKRMEVNLTIHGERGTLMADCFGPNVYHNGAPHDRYTVQYTYFDEWIGLVDEFVDCTRNGRTPQINLRWHRQTIEAMNACYESIAAGQPVFVKKRNK